MTSWRTISKLQGTSRPTALFKKSFEVKKHDEENLIFLLERHPAGEHDVGLRTRVACHGGSERGYRQHCYHHYGDARKGNHYGGRAV